MVSCKATEAGADQEPLLSVSRAGGRLDVVINRPGKRNALSRRTLSQVRDVFERSIDDCDIRVVVLTGAGDKSFAAGGDLVELAGLRTEADAAAMSREACAALEAVRNFPVPVVAALNGDALGGGAELAMACDVRLAAAHARIGFIQGRLAITSAWGGSLDLMAALGVSRALAHLCRSDLLTAGEALQTGLVDRVAAEDQSLDDAVAGFVAPMLDRPRHVLAAFKELSLGHRRGLPRDQLLEIETSRFARAWVHDDHWAAADSILSRKAK